MSDSVYYWYISGPISPLLAEGKSLDDIYKKFDLTRRIIQELHGQTALSPMDVEIDHEPCGPDKVTHLWGCYLKYDLRIMLQCHAIYMMHRWEESPGARLELYVASSVGMEVRFYHQDRV